MEKVIILGTGISGLTAAVYTARAGLKPLLISGPEEGGQLTLTTEVENFPGFPEGVMGPELVLRTRKQAEKFGARFVVDIVERVERKGEEGFIVMLSSGEKIETRTIIVSTGASAKWLGIASEKKYKGRGVTTCATCDGVFFKGKKVIVIGGGDSAMEEAVFLTRFASLVTVIHRRDSFRASKFMQDKFFENAKCAVEWNKEVVEVVGDGKKVQGVKFKDTVTGEVSDFSCDGVFLAVGHVPNTSFLTGLLELDEKGYLKTDRYMRTNVEGIFAAGDVQDVRYRQAITAAGSGCQAAMEAEKYLMEKGY